MNKITTIILALLLGIVISCHKEAETTFFEEICADELVSDYDLLNEDKKSETCQYLEVYSYQENIYFLCVCCVCDKDAIAYDCDDNYLCELSQNCMNDFFQEAIYQFSIVLK